MTTLAFVMWGGLPVYWKALQHVDSEQIIAHRIVWSFVFTALLLSVWKRWAEVARPLRSRRHWVRTGISALLLGANWYTYVWAINHAYVVESSLGYYITPLVNVLLGCVFLRERLRKWQAVSFVLAAAGVVNMVLAYGRLPWVALALAGTFGFYALGRKTSRLESLPGLAAETALLSVPAVIFLLILHHAGRGALGRADWRTHLLLAGAGVVTSVPLLCFAYGARRVHLATVGFLQYIAPTCTFLLGVFLYHEQFTAAHLVTFVLIWAGLAIYSWDSVRHRQ